MSLSQAGVSAVVLLGGIVGIAIAPSPALATLPLSLLVVGVALFVIPASLLMRRIGRRYGFMLAAGLAATGALLAAYALSERHFGLFCLATMLIGANGAFVQQYRFAATESVEPEHAGRAVSFVLLGGILAGFLGPEVATRTQNFFGSDFYEGSFISLFGLYAVAILFLSLLKDVAPPDEIQVSVGRPLTQIARQPNYLIAVMAGLVSYGVMTFIMTATPVHLNSLGTFSLEATALVIQSHIIAMYLPSLITGFLVERLGLFRIMVAGSVLLLACSIIGVFSREFAHFWFALVLLGFGWNMLFVGGTVLLTTTYRPEERFKTQASNDFIVFAVQASASLSAGSVLYFSSWERLNLLSLAAVVAAFILVLTQRRVIVRSAVGQPS